MPASSSPPQILPLITHQSPFTPFSCQWLPSSAKLLIAGANANSTGALQLTQLDTQHAALKVLSTGQRTAGIKCSSFNASPSSIDRLITTGDTAGCLSMNRVDELNESHSVWSIPKAHDGIINCLDAFGGALSESQCGQYGAPEIVTGGRDGVVRVWDPRVDYAVASIEADESIDSSSTSSSSKVTSTMKRDCWCVTFGNAYDSSNRSICAGYDNGDIVLFDLRMNKVSWHQCVHNGVVSLQFDRPDVKMNKLIATTLESQFHVFDMRTQYVDDESNQFASLCEKTSHKSTVWLCRHLPQNRDLFATTGGNGSLSIYKYNYPSQRSVKDSETGKLRGVIGSLTCIQTSKLVDQPIVSLDWHKDKLGLAAMTCLDQTVKIACTTKLNTI